MKKSRAVQIIPSSKIEKVNESTNTDTIAKILIVEDNGIAARAAISTIKGVYSQCVCDMVPDGKQAIEMVKKNQYDLIFMDIGLADDEDGMGVTRQLRALDSSYAQKVPIVALTGHADSPEMRNEILTSGMQDVFTKPLTAALLEPLMQQYVFRSKQKQSNTESAISTIQHTSEVIDWAKSVAQCGGNETFLRELLSMLALDLKMSQEKIAKTYTAHDVKALREELHRVRGGIAYLCVPQLDSAFSKFHEAVKIIPQNLKQLQQLYEQLQQTIEAFWEYVEGIKT